MPKMAKQDDLTQVYINALGVRALVVLAAHGGQPCKVSPENDSNLTFIDAVWFAKSQYAELVLKRCLDDLAEVGAMRPEGWIDLPGGEVRDAIARTARYLGASFSSREEIERNAKIAVDKIVASVEASRVSGGLAQVNAEYKAYRQRQISNGQPAISYSKHLANFTRNLVVLAAQNANSAALNL
jgi:hypothetical protein